MKRGNSPLVLCLFGILPVVWLGLLIAPAAGGGLPEILARFPAAMNDPFHIELCGDSVKTVLVLPAPLPPTTTVFNERRCFRPSNPIRTFCVKILLSSNFAARYFLFTVLALPHFAEPCSSPLR